MSEQNSSKKNFIFGLVIGIVIVGLIGLAVMSYTGNKNKTITLDQAKAKTIEYINNNLMQGEKKATVKEAIEENGLYKMVIAIANGPEITSYVTMDGKKFFPEVINMGGDISKSNKQDSNKSKSTVATKKDKPKIELFVMSYCPYGAQMEKGILPVLETFGDKVNFELKFVDYAMHGKKELDQNLIQYCIKKNEPEKLLSYLNCFLEDENKTKACLAEVKVNQDQLDSCVAATDKEFKVSELYADKSAWSGGKYPQFNADKADNEKYGVQGSPTLVINGSEVQSGRDSNSLLETICSGFNNPPAECNEELSSTPPAPGFGFSGSGSNSGAGCEN